jgi:hypothetical protein
MHFDQMVSAVYELSVEVATRRHDDFVKLFTDWARGVGLTPPTMRPPLDKK